VIRPLRDYIVVRPLEVVESAIIQVVQLDRKPARGEVMAVGPGKRNKRGGYVPWGARVGDIIQFTDVCKYPAIDYHGVRLLLLQEADICGIEEPEERAA
jgi:chaperonin GroES